MSDHTRYEPSEIECKAMCPKCAANAADAPAPIHRCICRDNDPRGEYGVLEGCPVHSPAAPVRRLEPTQEDFEARFVDTEWSSSNLLCFIGSVLLDLRDATERIARAMEGKT